jgi:hypothetical protein
MSQPKQAQSLQKEGRITLAIQAFQQGHFSNLKEACNMYDAPYSTTRDRVDGRVSQADLRPTNRKLTDTEESTLVQWILSMATRGLPVRTDSIQKMADILLEKRSNAT